MIRFQDRPRACPKCGFRGNSWWRWYAGPEWRTHGYNSDDIETRLEHLALRCRCCGYVLACLPVDAKP